MEKLSPNYLFSNLFTYLKKNRNNDSFFIKSLCVLTTQVYVIALENQADEIEDFFVLLIGLICPFCESAFRYPIVFFSLEIQIYTHC